MSYRKIMLAVSMFLLAAFVYAQDEETIVNPAIDMPAYLQVANEAARHRETHRLTEAEFIKMSREPNTVILDARSAEKYAELHLKNAVNLSFPDITVDSLAELFPDKNVRILIYCNNNFRNDAAPVRMKAAPLALNIQTFINLHGYGYRNVWELADVIGTGDTGVKWVSGV